MSDRSGIEWTDATWNPVTGCTKVSPGCNNCYAETLAERFRGTPGHYYENGFDLQLRPEKLDQPLRWSRPRRIFVNSMSDLFHAQVPDDYIADVFCTMAMADNHTFQLLTKRHGRMHSLVGSHDFQQTVLSRAARAHDSLGFAGPPPPDTWPLPNVWGGVSAEDQKSAELRIPALNDTPFAVRFVSCEPLLGPIELHQHWLHPVMREGADPAIGRRIGKARGVGFIDWVIVGGESGRGDIRPMHPDWARSLRDQCVSANVAFLFKQWGEWTPDLAHNEPVANGRRLRFARRALLPDGSTAPPFAQCTFVDRVGKRTAGRELDGRTWDEYPEAVAV